MGQVSRLPKISGLQFLHFLLVYLILWCGVGIAFFLFVKSLSPLEWHLIPETIGIYAMAWTVGFLSFITPAGLGIREGALSFLLSTLLPEATAIFVALLSRFWYLTVELALVGDYYFTSMVPLYWCYEGRRPSHLFKKSRRSKYANAEPLKQLATETSP